MENNSKTKKKSTRSIKLTTRITLSTVLGIVIPLLIVIVFSSVFFSSMAAYFNFSSVTTNSYSMLNQIQWSQTMSSLSSELMSDETQSEKIKGLKEFVSPIEGQGAKISIECNGKEIYATSSKEDVLSLVNKITKIDKKNNVYYFAQNGLVIVTHAEKESEKYTVIIADENYTVSDVNSRYTPQSFSELASGKTGLIILIVALLFIISIAALSIITSNTINKPIKKIAEGANEVSNGNLDYIIDYDKTDELGITVTAFNHMTMQLKESLEEQKRIEESRKEMIAGLAHDLRTPLTSAKGYVEGLLDGIANTKEKQLQYLKTIYSSTRDMEKLLDELLTISRLELGSIQLDLVELDLKEFFNDCTNEIQAYLKEEDFDFSYTCSCDEEILVNLDTDRFERVIRNIVFNSVKYKRDDVKGRIDINVQSYQKSVIISISDNGVGVEASSLSRIFESFYRADKARSNVRDGSGIGLAVCKQIVELHGGHIWATSKENEGLTILISLERINGDIDG